MFYCIICVFSLNKGLQRNYVVEYVRPDEQKYMQIYTSTIREDFMRSFASIASIKYKDKDGNFQGSREDCHKEN